MQKVLLEIVGTQRIDNQSDKMELTTIATIEDKESAYVIKYKEAQEPPLSDVDVCVTINKNEGHVEMTRSGAISSCLIIERAQRHLCQYGTEYGGILMGIYVKEIDINYNGELGSFNFVYDIDINGSVLSRNGVKMNILKSM